MRAGAVGSLLYPAVKSLRNTQIFYSFPSQHGAEKLSTFFLNCSQIRTVTLFNLLFLMRPQFPLSVTCTVTTPVREPQMGNHPLQGTLRFLFSILTCLKVKLLHI